MTLGQVKKSEKVRCVSTALALGTFLKEPLGQAAVRHKRDNDLVKSETDSISCQEQPTKPLLSSFLFFPEKGFPNGYSKMSEFKEQRVKRGGTFSFCSPRPQFYVHVCLCLILTQKPAGFCSSTYGI